MRLLLLLSILGTVLPLLAQNAVRRLPGFERNMLQRNDDGSTSRVPLPFVINFLGRERNSVYVNNNGNITFDAALATFTPFGLDSVRREIIAPFFADVDTRNEGSRAVYYGEDRVDGRLAFGVNYIKVGYFASKADRLNTFQLILIDRSDTGSGNFDVEFNYDSIQWETGDASGGSGGLGGTSASAGWSNGSGEAGTSYEFPGSLVNGAFLDNGSRALARRRLNSPVLGRYIFRARNGVLSLGLTISSSAILPPGVVGIPYTGTFTATGGSNPYRWTLIPDPGAPLPGLTMTPQGVLSGTPTARGTFEFTVSVTSRVDGVEETVSQRASVFIDAPSLQINSASCPPDGIVGSPYRYALSATGGPGPYLWSWGQDNASPIPGLSLAENGAITGTPVRAGTFAFLVRVAGPASSDIRATTRSCTVNIRPVPATPTIFACPSETVTATIPYDGVAQASGGAAPWRWTLFGALPTGFTFDPPTARLSGITAIAGDYPYTLQATDQAGRTVQTNCRLSVQPAALQIQTACPLPPTTTGQPFQTDLVATGGQGSLTWSLSGSLPAGIRLEPNGRISGSANDAGSWRFLLIARDDDGRTGARQCSLVVNRSPLSISACPLPDASIGQPYSQSLGTVGGAAPLRWSTESTLPQGLFLNSAGQIYGTPTQAGESSFRLQVADSSGLSTSQSCTLFVRPNPLRIERPCPLSEARLGIFYREYALATGGIAPYRWRTEGKLPPGITMNDQGVFTGTPSAVGAYPFSLILEDARRAEVRQSCHIESDLSSLPDIRITVDRNVTSNIPVDIVLSAAYPLPVTGDLILSSEANTGATEGEVNRPDPVAQILPSGRLVRFTMPPGTRSVRYRLTSLGTVAVTHKLRIGRLTVGGVEPVVSPSPAIIEVPRTAPVLSDACYTTSQNVLNLRLTGITSTRELLGMEVDLNGKKISNSPISTVAYDYFASPLSIRNGGTFQIEVPLVAEKEGFDVQVDSLTARVSNAIGASALRTLRRCN